MCVTEKEGSPYQNWGPHPGISAHTILKEIFQKYLEVIPHYERQQTYWDQFGGDKTKNVHNLAATKGPAGRVITAGEQCAAYDWFVEQKPAKGKDHPQLWIGDPGYQSISEIPLFKKKREHSSYKGRYARFLSKDIVPEKKDEKGRKENLLRIYLRRIMLNGGPYAFKHPKIEERKQEFERGAGGDRRVGFFVSGSILVRTPHRYAWFNTSLLFSRCRCCVEDRRSRGAKKLNLLGHVVFDSVPG